VYEHDFLGVIGPNGGGKTTLIKSILGLHQPDTGKIRFFKQGKEVPEIKMGYLPQYNTIDKKFPISVYEVILSGLSKQKSLFRRYNDEHHESVRQMIVRMGLEGLEHRAIGELSGGQLQRTLLGRALVSNPEVVILDEPSTYIDKRFETKLYSLLEEINQERAIILVSHDIGTVLKNVKTIACVNETVHYHPHTEVPTEWLEEHFGCPIEMLGHGTFPHRVLKCHDHEH
jgi:zinc transport system ATP-binding protein